MWRLLPILLACGGSSSTPGDSGAGVSTDGGADGGADGGSAGDTGVSEFCRDAPVVTWNSWGHGFLLESCQGCHASTAADRNDAPEEVVFDTVEDAWTWAPLILAVAAVDPPEMPPLGGTTADDRTRLRWWLECGEPGT